MKKLFFFAMLAQAVYWAVSGILLKSSPRIVINILMVADGACFAALAFLSGKNLFFRVVTALFLAANLILTFTDQMGAWDFIILAANIVCIVSFSVVTARWRKAKSQS